MVLKTKAIPAYFDNSNNKLHGGIMFAYAIYLSDIAVIALDAKKRYPLKTISATSDYLSFAWLEKENYFVVKIQKMTSKTAFCEFQILAADKSLVAKVQVLKELEVEAKM